MNESAENSSLLLSEPQHVNHPVQIAGILRRLQDAHALIHVSLPGQGDSWLSTIIEVQQSNGQLLIDELSPREGNGALQRVRRAIVSAQIQGVDISFATNLIESDEADGLLFHRMAMPDMVRYWQRRSSFRARVGASAVIPVQLEREDGLQLGGELFDISVGGIGSRHKATTGVLPLLGEIWEECRITLPDRQQITCGLEIRYVGAGERNGLRIGARFVDIQRANLKLVENFIAHLEREALRKRRRTRES